MNRPSKLQNFMKMAEVASERSHDAQTKVGAVLIKNSTQTLVSTGFNGFIPGADDDDLPNTRPDKYKYIQHAELNLLSNCGKNGISTNDCYVVSTMSPCGQCARMLYGAGITKVVAKELYKDFNEIKKSLDLKVKVKVDKYGYYHITYSPKKNIIRRIKSKRKK